MTNVLILASHEIAEYDDVRMFSDMTGVDVFAPGAFEDPTRGSALRPPLPNAPDHPELRAACDAVRHERGDPGPLFDWAKAAVPEAVLDWADVVIVHHWPERWLVPQLRRFREHGCRVVWRTCGQSDPRLEGVMEPLRREGLEIVRYSPAERRFFEHYGSWAGQDALIRFGKYPDDYGPWTGEWAVVGNVTQWRGGDGPLGRGEHVGLSFYREATRELPASPAGPGSEALPGGVGSLPHPEMLRYLARIRAYLYTGTIPASYTLGLIEAMLTGVPVVSIGAERWGRMAHPLLFEGADLTFDACDDPRDAARSLASYLDHPNRTVEGLQRHRAKQLFGVENVAPQWADFLGVPRAEFAHAREAVTA